MSEKTDQKKNNLVFVNGNILTMDDHNTIAEAVIVRDGLIEKVGDGDEIRQAAADNDPIVDLKGKTMLPGFVDAHSHFPFSGFSALGANLNSPPIGKTTRIPQIIEALRNKTGELEKGKWFFGFGYDDTLLEEKRHPDRFDLDEASPHHPIFISHVSGHLAVVNSLGLELAGINRETPDPKGGCIRRDPKTGEPTGVLEETALFPLRAMAMNFTPEESAVMIETAVEDYSRVGVTTAQCGLTHYPILMGLSAASQAGLVPLHLMIWPEPEVSEKIVDGEFETDSHNTDMFQIGAAKIIGDGSIQGYTAYLTEPYHVPFKGDAAYRGYPVTDRQEMTALVKNFTAAGCR